MKRMNNKGMTLVELIVTFSILIFIVLGMLEIVLNFKASASEAMYKKNLLEFTSVLNMRLQNDIISLNYVDSSNCSNISDTNIICKNLNFKEETKQLFINLDSKIVQYDGKNYEIPSKDLVEFRDTLVFEQEPANHELDVYIEDDGNYLIINIPFFDIATDTNYGFKIVHPVGGYTTTDLCFNFNSSTKTISDYYNYIGNNSANGACPKKVVIPNKIGGISVKIIGSNSFKNKGLEKVQIQDGIEAINDSAFSNNQIKEVILPDSLITIGNSSFDTNILEKVVIPSSVTTIGSNAFANNNLWNVVLGNSLSTIGDNAFFKSDISNKSMFQITNFSNNSFDWKNITGSSSDNTFINGTIIHQNGNILVVTE